MDNKDLDKLLRESYTGDSFGGETGLLAVREDASRYITQTDKEGIFNMFTEILDNSIDECLEVLTRVRAVKGDESLEPITIGVYLNQQTGDCTISDQGRGVTLEMSKVYPDLTTLSSLFEKDNTGSKGTKSGVQVSGYSDKTMGVHGAGAFVVTACSEYLMVEDRIYNAETGTVDKYQIGYQKGVPMESPELLHGRVHYLGTDETTIGNGRRNTGLTVSFRPDLDIMSLYNPNTKVIEEDFYLMDRIETRIIDTLHTVEDPMVINLQVEGEELKTFDSRELSITHDREEGVDYIKVSIKPDDTLKERMKQERVSDFTLDLLIMKADDYQTKNLYSGYVNRIKVTSSPHIDSMRSVISTAIGRLCSKDEELAGFFRSGQLRGLEIIPLLYVSKAQWGGQVKTAYTDYQVANYMGQALALSGVMGEGGPFQPLVDYGFQCSKPWLLAEKRKEQEMSELMRQRELQEHQVKQQQRTIEGVNDSLRYLNRKGELMFSVDIRDSDLILTEGKSAGDKLKSIMNKLPNIAVFNGLFGKIENINNMEKTYHNLSLQQMEARGMDITPIDKLDALLRAPFRRIIILSDNDADGSHIKTLIRFYIWREHRHIIEEGRLFEVSPSYCTFQAPSGLEYFFEGEDKVLPDAGNIRTSEEYEAVRRAHPGKVSFTLFKGVGSVQGSSLYKEVQDTKNWAQVPPLTLKEEYDIHNMFTDSSQFKKVFTRINYLTDNAVRKEYIRSVVYKDTTPKPEELVNGYLASDYPVFTSTSRKTIEDYEEMGSAEIEITEYKEMLNRITDMY